LYLNILKGSLWICMTRTCNAWFFNYRYCTYLTWQLFGFPTFCCKNCWFCARLLTLLNPTCPGNPCPATIRTTRNTWTTRISKSDSGSNKRTKATRANSRTSTPRADSRTTTLHGSEFSRTNDTGTRITGTTNKSSKSENG
jgi:hypothetical protein